MQQVTDIREFKRGQSVKLSEAGLSRAEIAQALSVSEAFVSKWRGRYRKDGTAGLGLSYRGSPGFLSGSDKQQVLEWIGEQSPYLSVETLETYLESAYGVKYESQQSYYNLLHQAGLSYKKPQAVNPKKDEQQILDKREAIKKSRSTSNPV